MDRLTPHDAWELRRTAARWWPARRASFAAPPLVGYLESPRGEARAGTVAIAGWLFGPGGRIERLSARAGDREHELERGLPRPDLEREFAGAAGAGAAGFRGQITVGDGEAIEIWAELSSGRRMCAFRLATAPSSRTPAPSPRTPAPRPPRVERPPRRPA